MARAESAATAAGADEILERLVDHEMRLTRLFHGAAEAGRVRDACMTARSLVQIAELLAKVNDSLPHPPTAPMQSLFVWPDGRQLPQVPLESAAALAEAGGHVSPAPVAPAPVAGAGGHDDDHGKAGAAPDPDPDQGYDYDDTDPFPDE